MKLANLLTGTSTLEIIHSKYNGEIKVIKDLAWGTRIVVDNLTQSGGIINSIWQTTFKKILEKKPHIKSCLILGLGGGTSAKLISQYWVDISITGIDIDKKIVDLGKKYLGLDKIKIDIKIEDAYKFDSKSYDLILIDLYLGDKFPEKFEDKEFLERVKSMLNKDGIAIFNRLYGTDNRSSSVKFGNKLEKIFKKVDYIYPQANIHLICYN